MKITKVKSLLFAAVCLLSAPAQAQDFSGSASQLPMKTYESVAIEFPLADVARKLGTDAVTLSSAINAYISAETPDPVLLSCNGTPWSADIEADAHGFWMDARGTAVGYAGEGACWFVSPALEGRSAAADVNGDGTVDVADISSVISFMAGTSDADCDVNGDGSVDVADISAIITIMAGGQNDDAKLTFYVGQMPNVLKGGENLITTITMTLNGQSVNFSLSLAVSEPPTYDVPQPTLIESKLTIVGEKEVVTEQYPRGGYDADAVSTSLEGVQELLGIPDMGLLENQIDTVVYATWYNDGDIEAGGGLKKDSLTNDPTGEGHGFWFRAVQNADGEEDGEVAAAGWGGTDKFFLNNFSYDAATATLNCQLGQYPGVCKDNETWFAYVYIVYGEKAYRIKYTLKLLEKEQGTGMTTYNKVGEENVTLQQEPTTDYSTVSFKVDVDAVAAALGCEVDAIGLYALDDKDNFGNSTANNGGFWFSDAGTVVSWGASAAIFIEPTTAGDYSSFNVGQYDGRNFQIGDEASASIYFMNGENYFQYNVTLKIAEPEYVDYGYESVATRAAQIQTLPTGGSDYSVEATYSIAIEDIEALIGTSNPTLYGLNNDSIAALKGMYSNAYSCDPKPGFWLDKDGFVSVWGDANARVGICYAKGQFTFFQYPSRNSVGDNFKSTLFLVNEQTNKMITINFTVSFVEKLTPVEEVGSENIVLPLSTDETMVKFDAQKACDALGISIDDLLSPANYYLRGMKADGSYSESTSAENGLGFTMDGGFDDYGDIFFTIEQDGDDTFINIFSNIEVDDDFSTDAQFCIEVNDQRYVYNVKFVSPVLYEAAQ